MGNSVFAFKQFEINQEHTAMKVGTDGVLLGAWANVEGARRILDVGTGTGLIALMAAQREEHAVVDAVEIEEEAYMDACQNVENSPWRDRIRVFRCSIQDFRSDTPPDVIVCNPPFFVDSTPAPSEGRTIARHCETLTHDVLLTCASALLSSIGRLCVILPVVEAQRVVADIEKYGLYVSRITRVCPTPEKAPKRWLMEFSRIRTGCVEDEMVVELSRHVYSEEYRKLTSNFYLYL